MASNQNNYESESFSVVDAEDGGLKSLRLKAEEIIKSANRINIYNDLKFVETGLAINSTDSGQFIKAKKNLEHAGIQADVLNKKDIGLIIKMIDAESQAGIDKKREELNLQRKKAVNDVFKKEKAA
jgi:hypothetical protein